MLRTTTPSCMEAIIWWERLRSEASSERYFSRSRMRRHCCTARLTTCTQVVRSEWLHEEIEGAVLGHLHGGLHGGEGGDDHHDRASREAAGDVLGDLEAVDARHLQVNEGDVGRLVLQEAERRLAVPRRADEVAAALQDPPHSLPHALLVVDDEHPDGVAVRGVPRRFRGELRERRAASQPWDSVPERYCSILPSRCSRGTGFVSTSSTFIQSFPREAPASKVKPTLRGAAVCMRMGTFVMPGRSRTFLQNTKPES